MRRESHVQFWEGAGVKLPRATRLVVLHRDRAVIEQCQRFIGEWLKPMGLELKPSKTRVTHTLEAEEGSPGFDFLGFNIRQYPSGKTRCARSSYGERLGFKTLIKPSKQSIQRHVETLRQTLRTHRGCEQQLLIKLLAPKIVGWCNYFAVWQSEHVFSKLTAVLFGMLLAWASRRHSHKTKRWVAAKYWRVDDPGGWRFQPSEGGRGLPKHSDTRKKRHAKVQGARSPFDGDWLYWSTRLGREPTTPARVAQLLREQGGRCRECGLFFRPDDLMEIDHVLPKAHGGTGARGNLQLLHRPCHDRKTARDRKVRMTSATSSRSRVTGNCHARF